MAASLYENPNPDSEYIDRHRGYGPEEYKEKLLESVTVYIGNLSIYTNEEQVYELFSLCGKVKRVIMGLDRFKRTPCGFCFVEYFTHEAAQKSVNCLDLTQLEKRIIRVDWDVGFKEGRQFGRGRGGGQKRDSVRNNIENILVEKPEEQENIGTKRERDEIQWS